jgi:hypothetical protein
MEARLQTPAGADTQGTYGKVEACAQLCNPLEIFVFGE